MADKVKFEFANGDKVRDTVTEFEGIVTAQFAYINGCKRYLLEAPGKDKGGTPEELVVDEGRLEKVKEQAKPVEPRPTGGARSAPARERRG